MDKKFNMDGHKLHWHLNRVSDWLNGKRIAPLYIDMGITQTCNIACSYCYYAVPKNKTNKIIPTDALVRFFKDAAEIGVKAVGLLGDGEPMIHPGVYDAVIAGSEAGLDMAIATNGLVMKPDRLKDFLTALTWFRFTMGAVTPEKYSVVMGTSQENYRKVIKNIEACVKIKKKYGLKVTMGLQMVLIPECSDEIVPFAKLGRDLGVDYAVVKQCSQSAGITHNLVLEDCQKLEPLFLKAEMYSNDNYDVIIKRRKMHNTIRRYDRCFGCEFLPQITGVGDVYVCGNFFGNKSFWAGNIIEQSFKDIVFGDKYAEVMKKVSSEVDVHKECGINCRQNEINEFLWTLKDPPKHVNFI